MKILILLALSIQAYAINFKGLKTLDIKNPNLRHFVTNWNDDFQINDAGSSAYEVNELGVSKDWIKTIQQIAYITNPYLEYKYIQDRAEVGSYYSIKEIIISMAYLDVPNAERAVEAFAAKHSDELDTFYIRDNLKLYFGDSEGSFGKFTELHIIDKKNKQFITLYGGYSE